MNAIATLIAAPGKTVLAPQLLEAVAAAVPGGSQPAWLAADMAADIGFQSDIAGKSFASWSGVIRNVIGGAAVDVVVQAASAHRRKKLLIADMDSTMIGQECIDELADFAGVKARVAAITERAMRGEIAFEPALRERVALLKGLPAAMADEVIATRIRLTPGAKTLVATMKTHAARTALVSGGFTLFTQKVAAMIGFESHRANVLLVRDGRLTGEVAEPILGRAAKKLALEQICLEHAIPRSSTLAVGDGANDLDMLGAASLGVAYHAKPQVAAAAHASIVHGDLTALLFAQGYRQEEFACG